LDSEFVRKLSNHGLFLGVTRQLGAGIKQPANALPKSFLAHNSVVTKKKGVRQIAS